MAFHYRTPFCFEVANHTLFPTTCSNDFGASLRPPMLHLRQAMFRMTNAAGPVVFKTPLALWSLGRQTVSAQSVKHST
jgi:hypothetical protein